MSHEQLFPELQQDGSTYQRHVYSGPLGDGYTDIWTKVVDGKTYMKCTHVGPENRQSHDWKEVVDGDI